MIYKVIVDWDEINIDDFLQGCQTDRLDVCFDSDVAYLYGSINKFASKLNIWKRENKSIFLKEITKKPENIESFVDSWIYEKLENDEKIKFEEEQQARLREMMDNINRAREDFRRRVALETQENK